MSEYNTSSITDVHDLVKSMMFQQNEQNPFSQCDDDSFMLDLPQARCSTKMSVQKKTKSPLKKGKTIKNEQSFQVKQLQKRIKELEDYGNTMKIDRDKLKTGLEKTKNEKVQIKQLYETSMKQMLKKSIQAQTTRSSVITPQISSRQSPMSFDFDKESISALGRKSIAGNNNRPINKLNLSQANIQRKSNPDKARKPVIPSHVVKKTKKKKANPITPKVDTSEPVSFKNKRMSKIIPLINSDLAMTLAQSELQRSLPVMACSSTPPNLENFYTKANKMGINVVDNISHDNTLQIPEIKALGTQSQQTYDQLSSFSNHSKIQEPTRMSGDYRKSGYLSGRKSARSDLKENLAVEEGSSENLDEIFFNLPHRNEKTEKKQSPSKMVQSFESEARISKTDIKNQPLDCPSSVSQNSEDEGKEEFLQKQKQLKNKSLALPKIDAIDQFKVPAYNTPDVSEIISSIEPVAKDFTMEEAPQSEECSSTSEDEKGIKEESVGTPSQKSEMIFPSESEDIKLKLPLNEIQECQSDVSKEVFNNISPRNEVKQMQTQTEVVDQAQFECQTDLKIEAKEQDSQTIPEDKKCIDEEYFSMSLLSQKMKESNKQNNHILGLKSNELYQQCQQAGVTEFVNYYDWIDKQINNIKQTQKKQVWTSGKQIYALF